MVNTKVEIGVKIELFNIELEGTFITVDEVEEIKDGNGVVTQEFVAASKKLLIKQYEGVGSTKDVPVEKFITDLTKGLNETLKSTGVDISTPKVPDLVKNVTVAIRKIYVKVDLSDVEKVEFALWVEVKSGTDNTFPIKFKKAYLKIWNTTDGKIKEELSIVGETKVGVAA